MSEAEWADENPEPSKRLIPTWLWFCGGGCLIAVILLVGAVMWGISVYEDGVDPEVQYAALEAEIGLDERPAEWTLQFGWNLGANVWSFTDSRGYFIMIMQFETEDAEEMRNEMFNTETAGGVRGMGARKDMELSTITVQGRELQLMNYYQHQGGGQMGSQSGQAATVEITPEGSGDFMSVTLIRIPGMGAINSGSEDEGEEEAEPKSGAITPEEVSMILAPLHIGPDR